ncbi:MAG: protein kinase [Pyrinomonadaceae bacterium]
MANSVLTSKPGTISEAEAASRAAICHRRWRQLCNDYLPISSPQSIWRMNRETGSDEPPQGWKLHVSATILDACSVFERVAPLLETRKVAFKAPSSLDELIKINSGIFHGYHQVGKFITVYPANDPAASDLAAEIHRLTKEFHPVKVPFDDQYCDGSSVFYRYGAFEPVERVDPDGRVYYVIRNPEGKEEEDDRRRAKPEWVADICCKGKIRSASFRGTPLGTRYRIFDALSQRGKGGLYLAFDTESPRPCLAIVKEGRKNGELAWNGQDGRTLAENEYSVLKELGKVYDNVPCVGEGFDLNGSFYFIMEFIEGESLKNRMDRRRRRFSIREILRFAISIAEVIEPIHKAGWVWNDCKPGNLMITPDGKFRAIDFEGSYPADIHDPFNWRSTAFSTEFDGSEGFYADLFSFGAVLYFLVTGRLYDAADPVEIKRLRRNVPRKLRELITRLVTDRGVSLADVIGGLKKLEEEIPE